jgi:hypothetical protein
VLKRMKRPGSPGLQALLDRIGHACRRRAPNHVHRRLPGRDRRRPEARPSSWARPLITSACSLFARGGHVRARPGKRRAGGGQAGAAAARDEPPEARRWRQRLQVGERA